MTTVAELVAAAEAAGVYLVVNERTGIIHRAGSESVAWGLALGSVARAVEQYLFREPFVGCGRCGAVSRRAVPPYWAEDVALCPPCLELVTQAFDHADAWPPALVPSTPADLDGYRITAPSKGPTPMSPPDPIAAVWTFLVSCEGKSVPAAELEPLLSAAWPDLAGSGDHGMHERKLIGRLESPTWNPPLLTFAIERHGAARNGSSRAEVQHWIVDLEARTATTGKSEVRQLAPSAPRLDVEPMAEAVAALVAGGVRGDARVTWIDDDHVVVNTGALIPNVGPKDTVAGRRKRLRAAVAVRLRELGWVETRTNHWARAHDGARP